MTYALFQNLSPGYGFTAIAVALLARLHPLGILATGLLFGALEAGAQGMQREAGVPAVAVQVAEAVIILVVVLADVSARRAASRGRSEGRRETTESLVLHRISRGRDSDLDAAPARRHRRDAERARRGHQPRRGRGDAGGRAGVGDGWRPGRAVDRGRSSRCSPGSSWRLSSRPSPSGSRADQIITGTAVTLGAVGLTGAIYRTAFGAGGPGLSCPRFGACPIPGLSRDSCARARRLFNQPVLTYVGLAAGAGRVVVPVPDAGGGWRSGRRENRPRPRAPRACRLGGLQRSRR